MTYLSQTRKTQKSYRSQREIMEKIKLFYKNADGEDKLPLSNITRINKVVDK